MKRLSLLLGLVLLFGILLSSRPAEAGLFDRIQQVFSGGSNTKTTVPNQQNSQDCEDGHCAIPQKKRTLIDKVLGRNKPAPQVKTKPGCDPQDEDCSLPQPQTNQTGRGGIGGLIDKVLGRKKKDTTKAPTATSQSLVTLTINNQQADLQGNELVITNPASDKAAFRYGGTLYDGVTISLPPDSYRLEIRQEQSDGVHILKKIDFTVTAGTNKTLSIGAQGGVTLPNDKNIVDCSVDVTDPDCQPATQSPGVGPDGCDDGNCETQGTEANSANTPGGSSIGPDGCDEAECIFEDETFNLDSTLDQQGPSVTITSPKAGQAYNKQRAENLLITADFKGFTPGVTVEYTYFLDATPISNCGGSAPRRTVFSAGTVASCQMSAVFLSSLPAGNYALSLFAKDTSQPIIAGAARSNDVVITLSDGPVADISADAAELAVVNHQGTKISFKLTLTAAQVATISRVEYRFDGQLIGTAVKNAVFVFDTAAMPQGVHTISATAYGQRATSNQTSRRFIPIAHAVGETPAFSASSKITKQGDRVTVDAKASQASPTPTNSGGSSSGGSARTPAAPSGAAASGPLKGRFTSLNGLIQGIIGFLLWIGGLAALLGIIIGGFLYITAGGDPQKAARARTSLTYSIVGLVIIIAASAIVRFIGNTLT